MSILRQTHSSLKTHSLLRIASQPGLGRLWTFSLEFFVCYSFEYYSVIIAGNPCLYTENYAT
jgi:hypothetical protein